MSHFLGKIGKTIYFSMENHFTSIILPRIRRKRICNASAFFLSKPCPFCAPAKRDFINICALKLKGKSHEIEFSLYYFSCENILSQYSIEPFSRARFKSHLIFYHVFIDSTLTMNSFDYGNNNYYRRLHTFRWIHRKTYPRDGKIGNRSFPDIFKIN